jgi:hypothetical protein
MRVIAWCLALCLIFPQHSFASEQDVHYGLTFYLAYMAGFEKTQAERIAEAAERYDEGDYDPATFSVGLILLSKDAGASAEVLDKHFPTDHPGPASPAMRRVLPDDPHAEGLLNEKLYALEHTQGRSINELITEFGLALHPLEDSWSHQGVPDSPFRPVKQFRSDLTWAHPCDRGGWARHDADLTYLHPNEILDMASRVYRAMNDVLSIKPELRARPSVLWSELAPRVRKFAEADTKAAKRSWFTQQEVPVSDSHYDFIAHINLPDVATPNHNPQYTCDQTIPQGFWRSTSSELAAIKDAVSTFFIVRFKPRLRQAESAEVETLMYEFANDLFIQWNIDKADKWMNLKGEIKPIQFVPNSQTSSTTQNPLPISSTVLLATFVFPDHGLANDLGHGYESDDEIVRLLQSAKDVRLKEHRDSQASIPGLLYAPSNPQLMVRSFGSGPATPVASASPGRSPFLISPLKKGLIQSHAIDAGVRGRTYAVLFGSHDTPHDLIFLVVGKMNRQWTIRRFYWVAG